MIDGFYYPDLVAKHAHQAEDDVAAISLLTEAGANIDSVEGARKLLKAIWWLTTGPQVIAKLQAEAAERLVVEKTYLLVREEY